MTKRPKVGRIWSPLYPVHNSLNVPLEWIKRRILVEQVLDFSRSGLSAEQFLSRPMLRRGSLLVIGTDVDLNVRRKFYVEATPDNDLPLLRIGAVNDQSTLIGWLGREYEPTILDREEMARQLEHWQFRFAGTEVRLGVFAA